MRLTRFAEGPRTTIGAVDEDGLVTPLEPVFESYLIRNSGLAHLRPSLMNALEDPRVLLATWSSIHELAEEALEGWLERSTDDRGRQLTDLDVRPFVPQPSKVFGLGYNYQELCDLEGVTPTEVPQMFAKMPTSVIGPFDRIRVPEAIDKVDFEAELGVIVGKVASRVPEERALEHLGGVTVVNDLTAKILPRPPTEAQTTTVALKGPDDFAPVGPVVVTPDEYADVVDSHMVTRVNGEERQRFPVNDWVHDAAATIAYASSLITLYPGDLISMGTSLGIGIVEDPPRLLDDGDVIECEIAGFPGTRNELALPGSR